MTPHRSDWCFLGQHDRCTSPYCRCECGCGERSRGHESSSPLEESRSRGQGNRGAREILGGQSGPESAATDRGLATTSTTPKGA